MKLCWLDIRGTDSEKKAILEEALHQRLDGIVAADPSDLAALPPTMTKVLLLNSKSLPQDMEAADVVVVDPATHGDPAALAKQFPNVEFGRFIEITDASSLESACQAARTEKWSVLLFRDPTKIPLEIVLAAADKATGSIVTVVEDVEEAEIVFGVLERGSDGVMMAPRQVGDATTLKAAAGAQTGGLELVELEVTKTTHVGTGERACVDTCSHFREDEGILVGSHSSGMILCCGETHSLPYMPARPFRVNAGAVHSYTLSKDGRTNYLSELQAGSKVLAVDSSGQTRLVTVGRVKIESRPLLSIDATAPNGTKVNLILQDDWHVRIVGPGGLALNCTELEPGAKILGYLPVPGRRVGYPSNEFRVEK